MATCGGTTTRLAKRPAIMPKFDKVIVAPRTAGSTAPRRRRACEASAQIRTVAFADIAQDGNDQTALPLDQVEIDLELARRRANGGKDLQSLGARRRLGSPRRTFAAVDLADDRARVGACLFAEFDQRIADLDDIALCAELPRNGTAPRRRYSTTALSVSTDTSG